MRYHYRCTDRRHCGLRRTLGHVQHSVTCECGKPMHRDPAVKRWNKKNLCRCDGAHYPHMKGTVVLCIHFDQSKFSDDELEEMRRSYG